MPSPHLFRVEPIFEPIEVPPLVELRAEPSEPSGVARLCRDGREERDKLVIETSGHLLPGFAAGSHHRPPNAARWQLLQVFDVEPTGFSAPQHSNNPFAERSAARASEAASAA